MSHKMVHDEIIKHRDRLTRQQIKTLHGQLKSGNVDGAYKGLRKLLSRMGVIVNENWKSRQ